MRHVDRTFALMNEPRTAVLIAGFGILLAGCDDAVVSPEPSTSGLPVHHFEYDEARAECSI